MEYERKIWLVLLAYFKSGFLVLTAASFLAKGFNHSSCGGRRICNGLDILDDDKHI